MRRSALIALLLSASANAAEITRVASSFEPNDPFGMFADVNFFYTLERAKIVREWYQGGDEVDVTELRYELKDYTMRGDIHLGLFRDLEFHFGIPVVLAQDRTWNFAEGTDATNSTIFNNCLNADGSLVSNQTNPLGSRACTQPNQLFNFDPQKGAGSWRSGLGDLTFGLAWAILNQKKDDAAPTWVLGLDYTAPIAQGINPSMPTSNEMRGAVGDKIHRYKFFTSISKRVWFADPYFSLHYTLPWKSSGFYSNCDDPSASRMAMPQNCGLTGWSREETAVYPAHVGGFIFGAEFNAFEAASKHQKLAIDIRGMVTYVSEGRYYNEMSDLFGKLLYTSDYVKIQGQIGIIGHAAEFVHLKLYALLGYNTEHTLTSENIGKDLVEEPNPPPGCGMKNCTVDVTAHPEEVSPLFDYRIDRVGRRFRVQETMTFQFMAQASFNF